MENIKNKMITFNRKELLTAIKTVSPAVPQKSILPILENLLVTVIEGKATIKATDTNLEISVVIPATGPDKIFTIPYAEWSRLLPTLSAESIIISIGKKLDLLADKDKFSFPIIAPEDYPASRILDEPKSIPVSADFVTGIKEAIKHCNDNGDVRFTGCNVKFVNDEVEIVGGENKFFRHNLPYKSEGNYHLQTKFVSACNDAGGVLNLNKNLSQLVAGNTTITASLSEYPFIDYSMVYKVKIKPNVSFDMSQLLPKLDSILSFGDPNFTSVTLSFKADHIDISYVNKDYEREFYSSVPCDNKFGDVEISYNAGFLKSILQSTRTNTIELMILGDINPTYIIAPGYLNIIAVLQK